MISKAKVLLELFALHEDVENYTIKNYGAKLTLTAIDDRTHRGSTEARNIVRGIVEILGDEIKKYLPWVVIQYIKSNNRKFRMRPLFHEDIYKLKEPLRLFTRNPDKFPKNQITQYQTWSQLVADYDQVATIGDLESDQVKKKRLQRNKEVIKLYGDSQYVVLEIKTAEASRTYGKGTKWCISAEIAHNAFDAYADDNNIVFIRSRKNPKEAYALLVPISKYTKVEIWDSEDKKLSFLKGRKLLTRVPKILTILMKKFPVLKSNIYNPEVKLTIKKILTDDGVARETGGSPYKGWHFYSWVGSGDPRDEMPAYGDPEVDAIIYRHLGVNYFHQNSIIIYKDKKQFGIVISPFHLDHPVKVPVVKGITKKDILDLYNEYMSVLL